MKKRLFYLAALIGCVGVLSSCNKNNENDGWKELPQQEIQAADASLTVNGQSVTTGSVQLSVLNAEQGTFTLKNVIDGYANIPVDVTLAEQSDGSYAFSGEKALSTAPVKNSPVTGTVLTVKISGTAKKATKMIVAVKLSGVGLLAGTYTGTKLALKYSGGDVTGKSVIVTIVDGGTANLTFKEVIPGQNESILSGVRIAVDGKFEGTTNVAGAAVNYNGAITDGVLTLDLNVKMADPSGWAKTYSLGEYTTGELTYNNFTNPQAVLTGPLYINYVCVTPESDFGTSYGAMFRGIGGAILPQVIKNITLEEDGNIRAQYSAGQRITFEPMWAFQAPTSDVVASLIPTTGWVESPKNLAYWFEKDGQMRVKLNLAAIIGQSAGTGGADINQLVQMILSMDPATLKQTLAGLLGEDILKISDATIASLLDWVKNGFPMSVKQQNGHTYLYLDKNAWDPMMRINAGASNSDIMILWGALGKAGIIPQDFQMAGELLGVISHNWTSTEAFSLGLDLK